MRPATVNGFKYQWTGAMKGNTFTGLYRANNGYFGNFVMKSSGRSDR